METGPKTIQLRALDHHNPRGVSQQLRSADQTTPVVWNSGLGHQHAPLNSIELTTLLGRENSTKNLKGYIRSDWDVDLDFHEAPLGRTGTSKRATTQYWHNRNLSLLLYSLFFLSFFNKRKGKQRIFSNFFSTLQGRVVCCKRCNNIKDSDMNFLWQFSIHGSWCWPMMSCFFNFSSLPVGGC
jgi:hypothetical protein